MRVQFFPAGITLVALYFSVYVVNGYMPQQAGIEHL